MPHAIISTPYPYEGGDPELKYISPTLNRQFDIDLIRETPEMRVSIRALLQWQQENEPGTALPEEFAALHATFDARLERVG